MENDTSWRYSLTDAEIGELDDAMRFTKAQGLEIIEIDSSNFPLPTLADRLRQLRGDVLNGHGFSLIQGVPVGAYSLEK